MAATDGRADGEGDAPRVPAEAGPTISAYSTTQERFVFTESGNGDGWIATDLTVEPRR